MEYTKMGQAPCVQFFRSHNNSPTGEWRYTGFSENNIQVQGGPFHSYERAHEHYLANQPDSAPAGDTPKSQASNGTSTSTSTSTRKTRV